MTINESKKDAVNLAKNYYNSSDAEQFYIKIWGGEDLHIGIYENEEDTIIDASRRNIEKIISFLNLTESSRVLDIGSGFGRSARHIARKYNCHTTCLNLSEKQNEINRRIVKDENLEELVSVVDGNFEEIPFANNSFDVVYAQDALSHSSNRSKVLSEVYRVLDKNGDFIFTDPIQKKDVPYAILKPILERVHLDTLGSFDYYREESAKIGFQEARIIDLSDSLTIHYTKISDELKRRYWEIVDCSSKDFVDHMLKGLQHWIDGGQKGFLQWGILHFKKL